MEQLPQNVPPELVYDFDMFSGPEVTECPHRSLAQIMERPDIFYTPRNGGHWVVTRQQVAVDLLQRPEIFSSDPTTADPSVVTTAVRRIPLDLDPPEHGAYRKVLNGMFSPKATAGLDGMIREHARNLVQSVIADGRCDFVEQIAQRYPVEIFLRLLGIPTERRSTFVGWVDQMFRAPDPAVARAASMQVATLMASEIADRRKNPGEDLISQLLKRELEGRPFTEDEMVGMSVLLFIGGLDTVVALLSFIMLFLAENPSHRRRLVQDRELIPQAIEEITRRHSIACFFRFVTQDTCFNGIDFRTGDRALIMHAIYGADDREMERPLEVDFDRAVSRHTAFGAGPHRCLGSHLARLELRIFLEEWLSQIPDFGIDETDVLKFRGGKILQPFALPMIWPSATVRPK